MRSESVYCLHDGVQVRDEKFGLLFYDYRGPKLHFLPCKDLIKSSFFFGQETLGWLAQSICAGHGGSPEAVRAQVNKILEMLCSKGLIHEQPVR